jgi:ribose transport system permease protein
MSVGTAPVGTQTPSGAARALRALGRSAPIFGVLALLLVLIQIENPNFVQPDSLLAFLKRSAPLMILAAGQLYVIVSGEYDLSVGSLITVVVVVAARLIDGDQGATWPVIALLFGLGAIVGVVNGLVTTRLRVPSFITTLAMLLVLSGAVFLWTDGAPRGVLSDDFRAIGRGGFEDVAGLNQLPYSVLLLLAVAAGAIWLLHRSRYGKQVLAAGGNPRAARLSGIGVENVRTIAFVLSATSAVIAGILLGGFAGVSAQVGTGYEFQAITAVVLGGAVLGGGRGSMTAAMAGALTLQALFTLLNLYGVSGALENTVQGVIVIAAVAFAAWRQESGRSGRGGGR